MKIAVVGAAGSIGKRRAGILEELGHKVVALDKKNNTKLTPTILKEVDATVICTPPNVMVADACLSAEYKVPFFLEKPGAANARDFIPIVSLCNRNMDLVNMVACNIRFTTEFKAIRDSLTNIGKVVYANAEFGYFLPWWREGNYRTYYSCFRMAGGGILMDAIHEFDYLAAMFGQPLSAEFSAGKVDLTGEIEGLDVEDSATVFIGYRNGPVVTVHLDYLQRAYKRTFSAVGTKGRIDQIFNVQGSNAMYRDEMKHFIDCVRKREETCKDVHQHFQLLEFVDQIREAGDKQPPIEEDEQQ